MFWLITSVYKLFFSIFLNNTNKECSWDMNWSTGLHATLNFTLRSKNTEQPAIIYIQIMGFDYQKFIL